MIPHIQPLRVLGGARDAVRAHMVEQGCQVGIHYKPNHLLSRFRQSLGELPVAERLGQEVMSIPLHPLLTDEEQTRVIELLDEAISKVGRDQ